MRNFLLGFGSALVLVGLAYGIYKFVFYPKRYDLPGENLGDCRNLSSSATDFGKVELEISSKSGQSVRDVEVNLGERPGAEVYCSAKTNGNGLAVFDPVPVGDYYLYFNSLTFPVELGGGNEAGTPVLQVKVTKGVTSEAGMELK